MSKAYSIRRNNVIVRSSAGLIAIMSARCTIWGYCACCPKASIRSQSPKARPLHFPPVRYLVGTPKGRLTRLEKLLVDQPWQQARQGVQVKLLA
jgi:hypothetical protein